MKVLLFKGMTYRPEVVEIDGELKSMQDLVGGLIEPVTLVTYSNDESLILICNEEGKLIPLPFNAELLQDSATADYIYGDFFICRSFEDELVGIEDDDISIAMKSIKR